MSDDGRTVTPRGFGIYAEFTDTKGSTIRVQQSSSAEEDAVWVFAEHTAPDRYLSPADREALFLAGFATPLRLAELAAKLEPSPHLDVAQARQLRDALDAFIKEAEARA